MNRGNLAEDPREDLPSGSRYARMGERAEENSLFAYSRTKHKEKNPLSAGKRGNTVIRQAESRFGGNTAEKAESVRRNVVPGGFDRLELGDDGRLFGVVNGSGNNPTGIDRPPAAPASVTLSRRAPAGPVKSRNYSTVNPLLAAGREQGGEKVLADAGRKTGSAGRAAAERNDTANPLLQRERAVRESSANPLLRETKPIVKAEALPKLESTAGAVWESAREWVKNRRREILIALLAAAGAAYGWTGVHYAGHFYPGTEIFGMDMSGRTAEEAAAAVREKAERYSLTLKEREDQTEKITADEIGLEVSNENEVRDQLKKQMSAFWPVMMLMDSRKSVDISTGFEDGKAEERILSLTAMDAAQMTAPKNAELVPTDDGYAVEAETFGTTLDPEKTRAVIIDALKKGTLTVDLDKEGCYENPTVFQDDEELNERAKELNVLFGADVTLDFGDRSEQVGADRIRTFISLDMDGNYYIDEEKVRSYVEFLAGKYDTWQGERTFYTSQGQTVALSGGDYGWEMDQEATVTALMDAMKDKKKGSLEPVYTHTAMSRSVNDIGSTYVEISISAQHMWVYKDGYLMVDTDVVTGNKSKKYDTPSGGVWAIDDMQRNAVLRGQGYASPVDFWVPFNGGVGIHDLKSRYYYGSTIYLTNGSHGCVNTPLEAMKVVFDSVEVGEPVIVYDQSQVIG